MLAALLQVQYAGLLESLGSLGVVAGMKAGNPNKLKHKGHHAYQNPRKLAHKNKWFNFYSSSNLKFKIGDYLLSRDNKK